MTRYDAFAGFGSIPWKYGFHKGQIEFGKVEFHEFKRQTRNGQVETRDHDFSPEMIPHIAKNWGPEDYTIPGDNEYKLPAKDFLEMHPGPDAEWAIIRFEVPLVGTYSYQATITSLKTNKIDPIVYLIHKRTHEPPHVYMEERMNSGANGNIVHVPEFTKIHAKPGDQIDLLVGYGKPRSVSGIITGAQIWIDLEDQ